MHFPNVFNRPHRFARVMAWYALATLSAGLAYPVNAAPSVTSPQPISAASGAELYERRCSGCHSIESDRIGPRHAGLAGRRAGSIEGFDYSPALKASKIVWNAQSLQRWLTDPEAFVPGQRMGFRLGSPEERVQIINYLLTL